MAGLWLLGSVTAGMLTVFEINERLDNAIEEVAQRLLPATYDAVQQPQAMQQTTGRDDGSQGSGLSDHRPDR